MSELSIEVQSRDRVGSRAARRLRREGLIPAVVYGGDRDTVPIQVDRRALLDLIKEAGSENAVFVLKLAGTKGKKRHCMVRDLEVNPLTREIVHVDFIRIDMKRKVVVEVPVEVMGEPVGVTQDGGILDHITREVEVECLPGDIPNHLEVDVSELHIGQNVTIGDVPLPDGVELTDDPDRVVASVVVPRIEEEPEEEEEMLLEAEMEEPELVGREKEEGEEGEEEGEEAEG